MFFISHRGNVSGPEPDRENTPDYIDEAIASGYDVEIDVRFYKNNFWLSHEEVDAETSLGVTEDWFLDRKDKLWVHAKDLECLSHMLRLGMHTFTHERDNATITSKGYVWTFTGRPLFRQSIEVCPERYRPDWYMNLGIVEGICSDHIGIFGENKFEQLSKKRKTSTGLRPSPMANTHYNFDANSAAAFAAAYGAGRPSGGMG